jgi:hypothetical protein
MIAMKMRTVRDEIGEMRYPHRALNAVRYIVPAPQERSKWVGNSASAPTRPPDQSAPGLLSGPDAELRIHNG